MTARTPTHPDVSDLDVPDLDRVAALIREVAATEILPRFRSLGAGDVRQKTGPTDLVTVADEAGERALTRLLPTLAPGSTVVGEEAASADPAVLDRLSGDAPVWVIDPVDGTINFASGNPAFAVIVAYVRGGRTLAGWIHDPCAGRTAMAAAGQGTWMEGQRLRVAAPAAIPAMRAALSVHACGEPLLGRVRALKSKFAADDCVRSAAHEYLALIAGRSHVSLYHRLMPWDHAAGVLLHAEAGGHAALLDGSSYRPDVIGGGLLVAPDRESWHAVRGRLAA